MRWAAILASLVFNAIGGAVSAAGPQPPGAAVLRDASLLDVCFADPQHGWAVGRHGLIVATVDGGRTWQQQPTPVGCVLHSVHFINHQTGWAVGGWIHPHTHRTTGVVLRTRDGGRRWLSTPGLSLPKLARVKFFDDEHGWALGESSSIYPSGLFRTSDAGRSWRTVPSGATGSLVAGDFIDDQTGAVAGRNGELQIVRGANMRESKTASLGSQTLRDLRFDGLNAWLAGDDGLLMRSDDAGNTWRLARPPSLQADQFDFLGVATVKDQAWVVGAPGSIVFHTQDAGRTWRALRTGQSLPLRAVHFVDPQRGWAVGDLGRILATTDGGQTWRVQRDGGQRAALLGVFSDPQKVPWEVLARYAGDEGYLTAVETLGHRSNAQASVLNRAHIEERLQAGAAAVGASSLSIGSWFPLRQAGVELSEAQLVELWDRANDGEALRRMEALVVRRIRQWRPDVVLAPQGESPIDRVVSRIVAAAVQQAADPTSHSLQLTTAGLQPWKPKKFFMVRQAEAVQSSTDEVYILPSQLAPRLGASVGEVASRGRAMERPRPNRTRTYAARLTHSNLPRNVAARELFHGLNLRPGGEARRELLDATAPLDVLTFRAQLTRNTESFADQTIRNGRADQWSAGLSELTAKLPPDGAGALLYELSETFRRQGRLDLAADVLERMVSEHPQHDLSESAIVQLIRYYTSSEDAWRRQASTFMVQQTVASERVQQTRADTARASDIPSLEKPRTTVGTATTQLGSGVTAAGHFSPRSRQRRAAKLAQLMRQNWPVLNSDPEIRFALAAVDRSEGQDNLGRFYQSLLSHSNSANPWTQRAAAEMWLAGGLKGQPSIPVCQCLQGPKPYLDGALDDVIWKAAEHLELHTPYHDDGQWPASAMLAWDLDFLYLAIRCGRPPGASEGEPSPPQQLTKVRQRDADMLRHDRVTLRVDVDRDYSTAFEFTVDERGWGAERCLGDASWDPKWHMAHRSDERSWTVEAAVPWNMLQSKAPTAGGAWAVDLHRVLPGKGVQSWTPRTNVERPSVDGFGLVIFQN